MQEPTKPKKKERKKIGRRVCSTRMHGCCRYRQRSTFTAFKSDQAHKSKPLNKHDACMECFIKKKKRTNTPNTPNKPPKEMKYPAATGKLLFVFEKQFLSFHIVWDTFHQQTRKNRKQMYRIQIWVYECISYSFQTCYTLPYHTVRYATSVPVYYLASFFLGLCECSWEKKTRAIKSADMDDSSLHRSSIMIAHVHISRWLCSFIFWLDAAVWLFFTDFFM